MNIFKSTPARRPEVRRADRSRRHLGLESLETRQVLSTFTVTNANDSGAGSLRDAILQADRANTAATINFSAALNNQTIRPLIALPQLNDQGGLTLNGGTTNVTIDLSNANKPDAGDGSFTDGTGNGVVVALRSAATVENLNLFGSPGRGVEVDGTATLKSVNVSGSRNGGAVNFGTLTLIDGDFYNNSARYYGGGVDNSNGTLTIEGTMFSADSAPEGGAIDVYGGSVTIEEDSSGNFSEFLGNGLGTAEDGCGGAIYLSSTSKVSISGTDFEYNEATVGGAIDNQGGQLMVSNTGFYWNMAMWGGAIDDYATSAHPTTLTGCDLEFNSASQAGGGIFVDGATIALSASTTVHNNYAPSSPDIYGPSKRTS